MRKVYTRSNKGRFTTGQLCLGKNQFWGGGKCLAKASIISDWMKSISPRGCSWGLFLQTFGDFNLQKPMCSYIYWWICQYRFSNSDYGPFHEDREWPHEPKRKLQVCCTTAISILHDDVTAPFFVEQYIRKLHTTLTRDREERDKGEKSSCEVQNYWRRASRLLAKNL